MTAIHTKDFLASSRFDCEAYLMPVSCVIRFALLRSCNSRQWQTLLCSMISIFKTKQKALARPLWMANRCRDDWLDTLYYITHQWYNILYQLAEACPHNVLHFLITLFEWVNLVQDSISPISYIQQCEDHTPTKVHTIVQKLTQAVIMIWTR